MILLFCNACTSIRYMEIETYNPSEVTYPAGVRRALIVNNALPQPANTGYEFIFMGQAQDTCTANADSALFDAARALGVAIAETDFFDDVLFFHEGTRHDESFLEDARLSRDLVQSLCEDADADAVISLDRLLFVTGKRISSHAEGYVTGSIDIQIEGVVRSYLPGRTNPVVTITVSDSVSFFEEAMNVEILSSILPSPEEALRIAGEYAVRKVYRAFTPHWETGLRWYFTGMGARWKEAAAYAGSEKWDKAAERWQYIYNHTPPHSGNKAKAAANLALAAEMEGNFDAALEWAKTSRDLFAPNNESETSNARKQTLYIATLEQRILNEKKLNLQIRK
jgi:hypothetical protein